MSFTKHVNLQTNKYDNSLEPTALDATVVDFDGVVYRISTPTSKNVILFSLSWQCFPELVKWGVHGMLKKEYGPYFSAETENGYNFTLEFNLKVLPEAKEDREELVNKVSLIKRNLLAQPFERAFVQQRQFEDEKQPNPTPDLMQIQYREQEAIYIQAQHDRVTVIFSTLFKEETDRIIGRVFLQEFVDARRHPTIQNAPQVLYSNKEPPLEIRHLPELQSLGDNEEVGYVTFGHPVPSSLYKTRCKRGNHIPNPTLSRLPPLSYKMFKSLHAFENASTCTSFSESLE
ncbi:9601_t:CDS:2 [Ambispora gerdemannii]|uniref:Arp2/3 complex 34 kDa subunit n=1 Tax=Ambispora gerdemannii TaxID=144530 RepID=A0A9N8UWU7_9GLOM|nr:9601_t:CDS:2 [Ambispora gerdemannii]